MYIIVPVKRNKTTGVRDRGCWAENESVRSGAFAQRSIRLR